jgi:hypothetical protein
MTNNGNGHSRNQGWRVHHLANLGGLIALAGLDLEAGLPVACASESRRRGCDIKSGGA